jgi:hypothetical protein
MSAPVVGWSARRRLLTGTLVVTAVAGLQVAAQALTGSDRNLLPQVLIACVQMPLTIVALVHLHAALERRRVGPVATVVLCMVAAGAIGIGCELLMASVAMHETALRNRPERVPALPRAAVYGFINGQLHCGLWVLAFFFPAAANEARIRALEADRLRADAEILRLRAHLEPHFLLNALNTVSGLVSEDPEEARRLVACIGDLLRDAVRSEDELRTVHDEVAWLERYAHVFEARYPGIVTFRWEIDEAVRGAMVPRMLLQPLVENAVRHGVLRRTGGGTITVRARVQGDGAERRVECAVEDDGPGCDAPPREGFGLKSVRRRLELQYPGSALALASSPEGTRCVATLPWLAAEGAA